MRATHPDVLTGLPIVLLGEVATRQVQNREVISIVLGLRVCAGEIAQAKSRARSCEGFAGAEC